MEEPVGLKQEVLLCAKAKLASARSARERGDCDTAIRLANEASDLADMVMGWHHLDMLLLNRSD